MGQGISMEDARRYELSRQMSEAQQRLEELQTAAAAEEAAGIPPQPCSKQALYRIACQHLLQLSDEYTALTERSIAQGWRIPKMPKPTPRWEEVLAGLAVAEPSTPAGSGSPVRRQRGSSSDEGTVPSSGDQLTEAAPLLADGAGPSAPGLRRRQGHEEALS
ncbi:hypothetical protein ABPG75_001080 [Micractinium tetrahymenae]